MITTQIEQIPDGDPVPEVQEKKIWNFYLKVFPQSDKVVNLKGKLKPLLDKLFPPSDAFEKIKYTK